MIIRFVRNRAWLDKPRDEHRADSAAARSRYAGALVRGAEDSLTNPDVWSWLLAAAGACIISIGFIKGNDQ